MIKKKSRDEIKRMRKAGHIVALVHAEIKDKLKAGMTTKDLDDIAMDVIHKNKAIPTFLGYNGFPASICTSVNEQIVHGIPSKDVVLEEGDIISVDVGATYGGLVGDSAWTHPVGEISEEKQRLLRVTEESLFAGLAFMKDGCVLDDVQKAIEAVAVREKMGIVRQYGGHGVGHVMHEEPFVFNYSVGNMLPLKSGMTIAIEPMLNLGGDDVIVMPDKWTVVTKDKQPSAHFEHTVLVTEDGPDILTKLMEE